jgi:hypothetical protein
MASQSEDDAIRRIRALRGVPWTWREDAPPVAKEQPGIGVIAQDVENVFPAQVSTDEHGRKQVDCQRPHRSSDQSREGTRRPAARAGVAGAGTRRGLSRADRLEHVVPADREPRTPGMSTHAQSGDEVSAGNYAGQR